LVDIACHSAVIKKDAKEGYEKCNNKLKEKIGLLMSEWSILEKSLVKIHRLSRSKKLQINASKYIYILYRRESYNYYRNEKQIQISLFSMLE